VTQAGTGEGKGRTGRKRRDRGEMYQEFFKLDCKPFDLAPDPRFLYLSEQHSRAAANVRFALMNHDSFVVVTGEIGTGKTTVLNMALRELGPQYVTARLVHTTLSDIELLQALLSEFGIPNYGTKRVKLLDELRMFFLEQHLAGRHVVIIIDEAQHLSHGVIEELRLLSCIDTQDRRIVSIALTGQPTLDDVLDHASMAPLRQRTRLRQRLRPLDMGDTSAYIKHRIAVAGGDADKIFTLPALREIHRLTLGTPRLINTLCDSVLMFCKVGQKSRVDVEMLASVVDELGWRWPEAAGRRAKEPDEQPSADALGRERATLRAYSAGRQVAKIDIENLPCRIGRGSDNDLVIPTHEISRHHALIDRSEGRYIVTDLDSRNGLLVNSRRCDTAPLKSGDVITMGLVNVIFSCEGSSRENSARSGEDTGSHILSFVETQTIPHDSEALPAAAQAK
jgi:type II secretory pathway predicted ATPase ExeA